MQSKNWERAAGRVLQCIEREVAPILQRACDEALKRFPKAKYIGVREAMGSVWIEIDGLHFHHDKDDFGRFHVVGYKGRPTGGFRMIRAHRLMPLAESIIECGDFLDQFHCAFPDVTARSNGTRPRKKA